MSSENIDQNLNNNLEQVQRQIEVIPPEKNCDITKSDVEVEMTNIDRAENTDFLANDVPISRDSPGGREQFVVEPKNNMDQNLNTVGTVSVVDHVKKVVDSVSDTNNVVIVENITNSLTEKNMRNIDDVLDSCPSPGTKRTKSTAQPKTSTEKLIQNTLIHKVNELDISGRVNQRFQNNKSAVVLKMHTDSLNNLMTYESSSDDDDDDFEKNWQVLALPDSYSDVESDSSNESVESSDDDTDDVDSAVIFGQKNKGAIKKDTSKTAPPGKSITGILDSHDLPPVPDLSTLNINVEKEEFLHMGHIQAIIDTLVTVEANLNIPAYDLDSYLFIEDKTTKKPLGAIYDVIGPVTSPIYCIRYNSTKDIQDLQLKQGMKVFSAPKSEYTHYVFLKELMKFKGTDASWVGDKELPAEVAAELSEDEEDEHNLQNTRKAQKRKHGSLERHKQFEKSMNRCNALNTRVAQLVDAHRHLPRPIRYNDYAQRSLLNDFHSVANNRIPAPFDPTVPPPGFHGYSRQSNLPAVLPPMHWNWLPHEVHRPSMPRPNMSPFTQGQNNSANYYTNNAGRNHSAGSSTQPY